jgi:hypothetical protein
MKVVKTRRSPKIWSEISREGCETVYCVGEKLLIEYEDGCITQQFVCTDGKIYRKVDHSDHPEAVKTSTYSPTDFVVTEVCFEPL